MPLFLLLACAEPFEVSRNDLGPFRIATVGVEGGVARAEVWSGVGMGHPSAPSLSWSLDGQELGEGFEVEVPGPGTLGLVATSAEGEEAFAEVSVREPPGRLGFERLVAEGGEELLRSDRLEWPAEPLTGSLEAEGVVRFEVVANGFEAPVRWMTAGGHGTLLELEDHSADAFASEIVFSEEQELLSREELGPTLTHHLVLALDGEGGNDWLWLDAAFGIEQPLLRHRGRLLPVEDAIEAGLVAVTLEVTNDLNSLAFVEAESVEDLAQHQDPGCAPSDQPFELSWVSSGRCGLDEIDGLRVVLETW